MSLLLAMLAFTGTCAYAGLSQNADRDGLGNLGLVFSALFVVPLLWISIMVWIRNPGTPRHKLLVYRAAIGLGLAMIASLIALAQFLSGTWTTWQGATPGAALAIAATGLFVSCVRLINRERL